MPIPTAKVLFGALLTVLTALSTPKTGLSIYTGFDMVKPVSHHSITFKKPIIVDFSGFEGFEVPDNYNLVLDKNGFKAKPVEVAVDAAADAAVAKPEPTLAKKATTGYADLFFRLVLPVLVDILLRLVESLLFCYQRIMGFIDTHSREWVLLHLGLQQLNTTFESVLNLLPARLAAILGLMSMLTHKRILKRLDDGHQLAMNARDDELRLAKQEHQDALKRLSDGHRLALKTKEDDIEAKTAEIKGLKDQVDEKEKRLQTQKGELDRVVKENSDKAKELHGIKLKNKLLETQLKDALATAPKEGMVDTAFGPRPASTQRPPLNSPSSQPVPPAAPFNPAAAHFVPQGPQYHHHPLPPFNHHHQPPQLPPQYHPYTPQNGGNTKGGYPGHR